MEILWPLTTLVVAVIAAAVASRAFELWQRARRDHRRERLLLVTEERARRELQRAYIAWMAVTAEDLSAAIVLRRQLTDVAPTQAADLIRIYASGQSARRRRMARVTSRLGILEVHPEARMRFAVVLRLAEELAIAPITIGSDEVVGELDEFTKLRSQFANWLATDRFARPFRKSR
jgi:hypothetical protein